MSSLLSLFVLSLLFLLTQAYPAPIGRRGVSAQQFTLFQLFEQYSGAAYCDNNEDDGSDSSVLCSEGNCPMVQQANATTIVQFNDEGTFDTTGYVAIDPTNKLIVIAFRGSTSLGNWIGNFDFGFADFDACDGCQVHAGFYDGWKSSESTLMPGLQQAVADNPSYSIVATGHSMGAAVSTIAAADLRNQGYDVALYTFGSPMVGNGAFASFVTNQAGGNYRITHASDAVPKLPGYLLDFRHVSPEYWITSETGTAATVSDIKMSSGTFNLAGNQGTPGLSIVDHLWYFNSIAACTLAQFTL